MKKILLSAGTLFSLATIASNASPTELLVGWDFSSLESSEQTVQSNLGKSSLALNLNGHKIENGSLVFDGTGSPNKYANVGISSLNIGPASNVQTADFSVALTFTHLPAGSGNGSTLWSAKDNKDQFRTGLNLTQQQNTCLMWQGSSTNRPIQNISSYLTNVSKENPLLISSVFTSSGAKIYINGKEILTDSSLTWSNTSGFLNTFYLGAWANNAGPATMSVSKVEIYRGAFIPEPSMFGVLAGISSLALVASRRRRKQ